jgi:hypothetical protein
MTYEINEAIKIPKGIKNQTNLRFEKKVKKIIFNKYLINSIIYLY